MFPRASQTERNFGIQDAPLLNRNAVGAGNSEPDFDNGTANLVTLLSTNAGQDSILTANLDPHSRIDGEKLRRHHRENIQSRRHTELICEITSSVLQCLLDCRS